MTNDNNGTISSIGRRIIHNRWIYFFIAYYLIYALLVNTAQSEYLSANRGNITLEVQKVLNHYTVHYYILLLMFVFVAVGWSTGKRSGFVMGMITILGLFYYVPDLWVYQVGLLGIVITVMMRRSAMITNREKTETDHSVE